MEPSSNTKRSVCGPRFPRWGRRLLITLAVLVVLGALATGPGARWLIRTIATSQLEKQGLAGDLEVDGHLFSGFEVSNIAFEGAGNFQRLSLKEAGIEYKLTELFDKKVRRLHARELELELTIVPKDEEDKEPLALVLEKLGANLRKWRALALPVSVEIDTVKVVLNKPDGSALHFNLGTLTHEPQSAEFAINGISSNVLGDDGLPPQDITITWQPTSLALSRVEILPELAVTSVHADFPTAGPLAANATVALADSALTVSVNESGSLALNLTQPPLDLARLPLPPDAQLGGRITSLNGTFEKLLAAPDDWTGTLDLHAEELSWQNGTLPDLLANIAVTPDATALTAQAGPHLKLDAQGPHPDLSGKGPAALLDGAVIEYTLLIDSIHGWGSYRGVPCGRADDRPQR